MAAQYRVTYKRLKDKLRHGSLIHADETKGDVKQHSGYVWAFTNMEEVVYTYTATREGTILDEMLNGFTGVLVSDFYAAYDSTACPQQKCLVHLMRDINHDIFRLPFDEELKQLAHRFVTVLKPIIDTIDEFGLKKYYLRKHKDGVARFFAYVASLDFGSEVAQQYQKRVLKYREKLFVFLDHDGIPWNNNARTPLNPSHSAAESSRHHSAKEGHLSYGRRALSATCPCGMRETYVANLPRPAQPPASELPNIPQHFSNVPEQASRNMWHRSCRRH